MTLKVSDRVICVGFNKTGTSTVHHCFSELHFFPVASPSTIGRRGREAIDALFKKEDYGPALELAEGFKAFEDRPWNVWEMYKRLDERFPDGRFILTERDPETWWRSVHHWITVANPERAARYRLHLRASSLDKDDMVRGYLSYNEEVKAYFEGTGKLLVMNFEKGDGWEKLCSFLECAVPAVGFPHANRQAYTQADRREQQKYRRTRKGLVCLQCGEILPKVKKTDVQKISAQARRYLFGMAHKLRGKVLARRQGSPQKRVKKLRAGNPSLCVHNLAAVTCYFNPCCYQSRLANFRTFHEGMRLAGVPLLTVELAIGDQAFQLDGDFGEVLQLRCPDILWHKERLLNLGIEELLRRGYEKIVWLDGDIVFEHRKEWPWYVADKLDEVAVCQVFSHVWLSGRRKWAGNPGMGAVWYYERTGDRTRQYARRPSRRHPFGQPRGLSGLGWAARAEVLREVQLYDASVLGGGDKLIYASSLRRGKWWDEAIEHLMRSEKACPKCGSYNRSAAYAAHFRRWAEKWAAIVDGRVGHVNQVIRDLYHGARARRYYSWRHHVLFRHSFDPDNDLRLDENGCWRWASDKPELHQEVSRYFLSREEDL